MATRKTKSARRNAATHSGRWRPKFLKALSITGNVTESAAAAGVVRKTAYDNRERDKEFAAAWDDAIVEASDVLESEARRRAVAGVDEPVVFQGELSGIWVNAKGKRVPDSTAADTPGVKFIPLTVKKYSDTLLIFLMKGANPRKYREHHHHTHDGDVKLKPADGEAEADRLLAALRESLGAAAAAAPRP